MQYLKKIIFLSLVTLTFNSCWLFNDTQIVINPKKCFSFTKNTEDWKIKSDNSWNFTRDGRALSHNWNNRKPIASRSQGGALVFNGDALSARGVKAQKFTIESPLIPTPTVNKLGVTFTQYFKNFKGKASLEIKPKNGVWISYPLNENYGNFMESLPDNKVFVDISSAILPNTPNFYLRFVYEGSGSFWIIDDVCLTDITDLRVTKPASLAQKLCDFDYPFFTDNLGGTYIPNETVIEYKDTLGLQAVRDLFQITDYESCNCNNTELWKSPIVLTPIKDTINGAHFPLNSLSSENIPFSFSEISPIDSSCNIPFYAIVENIQDVQGSCNFLGENTFEQHTTDFTESGMLLIKGNSNTKFTLNSSILKKDSLYVLSFFANDLANFIPEGNNNLSPLELEISIGNQVFTTVEIKRLENWGRYDILLKGLPTDGLLNFQQMGNDNFYAIDDICLSRYILSDNTIIDINGVIERTNSTPVINESDLNYYNFDTQPLAASNSAPFSFTAPKIVNVTPDDTKVIAVLDTGIDYSYELEGLNIKEKIHLSKEPICYDNDVIGYNFVDPSLPPYDDSRGGHGTHVAGIIIQNIPDDLACDYSLLPIKTHDTLGMSTLFRVSCGISYATQAGAKLINASWGYYGAESPILRHTIENAKTENTVIICSAGNEGKDILVDLHWPSAFDLTNLITVAATNDTASNQVVKIADFSNRNAARVEYGTAGMNILSSVPQRVNSAKLARKDGSSMSAPLILSMYFAADCICGSNLIDSRKTLQPYLSPVPVVDRVNFAGIKNAQYVDPVSTIANMGKCN